MFLKMLIRCFCRERRKKFKMKNRGALAEVNDGGPSRVWPGSLKHLWLGGWCLTINCRIRKSYQSVSAVLTKILDKI